MSSAAAALEPKFPWDIVKPDNAFWKDIDNAHARAFLTCFTPTEVSAMALEQHASLHPEAKLQHLRQLLADTLASKTALAAPSPLHATDYRSWRALRTGLCTLSPTTDQIKSAHFFYTNGPNGTKDPSALMWLAQANAAAGKFSAAESYAKDALTWIEGLEGLGPVSPQALGCLRMLIEVVWKQGKQAEAEGWVERATDVCERLGDGKFRKYQGEEVEELERVVREMEGWKGGGD